MQEIQELFEISEERKGFKQLLIDDEQRKDFHEKTVKTIIKRDNLPKPKFTHKYFRNFVKCNRLSLRNAHYMRRGAIDMKYVRIYISKLAQYCVENGQNNVYNMDETIGRHVITDRSVQWLLLAWNLLKLMQKETRRVLHGNYIMQSNSQIPINNPEKESSEEKDHHNNTKFIFKIRR